MDVRRGIRRWDVLLTNCWPLLYGTWHTQKIYAYGLFISGIFIVGWGDHVWLLTSFHYTHEGTKWLNEVMTSDPNMPTIIIIIS